MRELANYSIETDEVVLLVFNDGHSIRVLIKHLSQYLSPPDLKRVHRALRLRHDFLTRHMPKTMIALAAGGLMALFFVGSRPVAGFWHKPSAIPIETPANHRDIAVRIDAPSPIPTPAPSATISPMPSTHHTNLSPPLIQKDSQNTAASRKPQSKPLAIAAAPITVATPLDHSQAPTAVPTPQAQVAPRHDPSSIPSPSPEPISDEPSELGSDSPRLPGGNQDNTSRGNVLGDSTVNP